MSLDADLVSAVILRDTGALGLRSLFNIGIFSLCMSAMLACLFVVGLGPLALAVGTTAALLSVITFHIHQISTVHSRELTSNSPTGHTPASAQ